MSGTPSDSRALFLMRTGLIGEHNGQLILSTKAVALLTGTPEESWTLDPLNAETVEHDDRSAEIRARLGTDDPLDVLYALATQRRELKRSADVDEQLKALDG